MSRGTAWKALLGVLYAYIEETVTTPSERELTLVFPWLVPPQNYLLPMLLLSFSATSSATLLYKANYFPILDF